jgi:TusA-related sulfurtransferase
MKVNHKLDLRGEVCPYTFVKTKLALEQIELGEVLEVTLDHRAAVENVPRSVSREGHEVLEVQQVSDSDWTVSIRRGGR